MEDRHVWIERLVHDGGGGGPGGGGGGAPAYCAVFDGHTGATCADFLSRTLHANVAAELAALPGGGGGTTDNAESLLALLRRTFLQTDQQFLMEAVAQSNALQQSRDSRYAVEHEKAKWLSGSTAVCALFSGAEMLVAHVGDSEAVLCRDDRALPE